MTPLPLVTSPCCSRQWCTQQRAERSFFMASLPLCSAHFLCVPTATCVTVHYRCAVAVGYGTILVCSPRGTKLDYGVLARKRRRNKNWKKRNEKHESGLTLIWAFLSTCPPRPKKRIFTKRNRHFYNRNCSTIFFWF